MKPLRHSASIPAVILLLLLIFGLPSLFFPFGRDQGIHAQVGGAWLAGEIPYRDVWHPKGFLSFVPHLLATAVFGHQMGGIRLLDLIWQFASGLLIFQIGQQRMSSRGALIAVGLFYLIYYNFGYWHTAQPEGFQTPFILSAVLLYDRASESKRPLLLLFGSGFVVALAPWFKQTAVVFIVALLAWAAFDYWRVRDGVNKIWPLLGGVLTATGLVVGFTAVTGMLDSMLEAFDFAFFEYPNQSPAELLEIIQLTGSWGIWFPALIVPFLAGLGLLLSNRPVPSRWLGIMLMAAAGLASVYIQRHLWLYHLVSSLPFMLLIGAFSLDSSLIFLQSLTDKRYKSIVWLCAFGAVSLLLPPLSRHLAYDIPLLSYLSGRTSREAYLEDYELRDVIETAEYLAQHTGEEEPIFVWGHYAMIYYLAERPNPTRFINDPPLSLPHQYQAAWRQEVITDLIANPPVYIVVATDDETGFEPQTSEEQLSNFPALADFLATRYQLETNIGDFEIYKHSKQ